ncbi:MAG: hypothetical protein ACFB20_11175 [Opitutales bacterium]
MLCCFLAAFCLAARAEVHEAENLPPITDAQVPALLSVDERRLWQQALARIEEGKDDIDSGQWMLSRKSSDVGFQRDLRRVHEGGREKIAQGEAKIAQAEERLTALRLSARQRYALALQARKPIAYSFQVPSAAWGATHQTLLQRVLTETWEQGYARILFGGHHVLDTEGYYRPARLNQQAQQLIRTVDADRFTYAPVDPSTLNLGADRSRLVVQFPDSGQTLSGRRAALLIGEMLPFAGGDKYLFSIRAIDLESLQIVASGERILLTDESLEQILAREAVVEPEPSDAETVADASADATAGDETEVAAAPVEEPAPSPSAETLPAAMEVTLNDLKRFIERLERTPNNDWKFGLSFDQNGHVLPFRDKRRAILIAKLLLLSNGGPPITDTDFLVSVLPQAGGSGILTLDAQGNLVEQGTQAVAPENAMWVVTHERGSDGNAEWVLKAQRLDGNSQPIEVGPLRIGSGSTNPDS